MNCPGCSHQNSRVLESRVADAGDTMRRRRECLACSERFTTYERIELPTLWVRKHDGRHEQFDRAKLLRGLAIACSKRDVDAVALEALVTEVEASLRTGGRKDVTSDEVGERALAGLVRLDEPAAVRFASVIQRAESVAAFREVLDRMHTNSVPAGDETATQGAGADEEPGEGSAGSSARGVQREVLAVV